MIEGRAPRTFLLRSVPALLGLLLLAACGREPEAPGPRFAPAPATSTTPTYRFAVHPLHNPAKLIQSYQPLIDHLNANLRGARLELLTSRDYAEFEQKYQARKPEFLLPNPWQTLQAEPRGYHVIAMAGEPRDFTGIILVRRDSGVQRPQDLKGKAISYPSATALAACIMPQYFLHTRGLDINRDVDSRYVGSQESSIMNVYLKLTSAGATWPTPWRAFQREHPQEAAELKVAWETEPLINNSVMARDDLPPAVVEQVRTLLLNVDRTPDGKGILHAMETARFLPATDADYEQVRAYVARFEQTVRAVARP